mgnify:FL=1
MKYLFSGQPELRQACEHLLRVQPDKVTPEQLLQDMLEQVRRGWTTPLLCPCPDPASG